MYDPFLYTLPLGTNLYFGAAEYPYIKSKILIREVYKTLCFPKGEVLKVMQEQTVVIYYKSLL